MLVKKLDREFLSALKGVYNAVCESPHSINYKTIRELCSQQIKAAFTKTNFQIKGSESVSYTHLTLPTNREV